MPDGNPELRPLSLSELEHLRDEIRVSVEHARDELERIEGLILIALFRQVRDADGHNGVK